MEELLDMQDELTLLERANINLSEPPPLSRQEAAKIWYMSCDLFEKMGNNKLYKKILLDGFWISCFIFDSDTYIHGEYALSLNDKDSALYTEVYNNTHYDDFYYTYLNYVLNNSRKLVQNNKP
jgi:hypothetical protein